MDDRVRVQLRRDIAIDRPGGIVLKPGCDKCACGLGRTIATDAALCVMFGLVEGNPPALPVRLAHTPITADQRGERNRFRRGKGCIAARSVPHCLDCLAFGILIFIRCALPDKLLARLLRSVRAEFGEAFGRDRPGKAELRGQLDLPVRPR